ncbi:DUF342 domain-containing protein [Vibrio sp.]|uniref:DUF342 domain-containing protein n=1 Tax=Vibrio sp. TaxID=678 RepID=UPI003D10C7C5
MWHKFVSMCDEQTRVIAKLSPDITVDSNFGKQGLEQALVAIGAGEFYLKEEAVSLFINCAREMKSDAYTGIPIAEVRDAAIEVELGDLDMLATVHVTGAYGGKPLTAPQIIQALAKANVIKGINKLALKKTLLVSQTLKAGEVFHQPVAQGRMPIQGEDAQFVPLVEDISKQILAPKTQNETGKVDMLNLGETISVEENQPLMKRIPATKGTPGFTVQGRIVPPTPGKDSLLKASKGSQISATNPNLLVASLAGMPLIKEKSVEVENALCLPAIGVASGHVKFKGNVVVIGNIESDMKVRATGSITVGGFIESADVQAQGDIKVAKGIIGHNVSEGEAKSCTVKAAGSITANYAQFSDLQAGANIELSVHCMNNELRCGGDLVVSDTSGRQGTLSGGRALVGGKTSCVNLGVEGDTPTFIQGFARFSNVKDKLLKLKADYKLAQEGTMEVIRRELEFKKIPKSERSDEQEQELEHFKQQANQKLTAAKNAVDVYEGDFQTMLEEFTIVASNKVYSHVTVQFDDERITTRRTHGPSEFSFNQYEIKCTSKLGDEAITEEM